MLSIYFNGSISMRHIEWAHITYVVIGLQVKLLKINFLISQSNHMLCVLKRTVCMRPFFWAQKQTFLLMVKKVINKQFRDFPRPNLGPNICPFPIKNEPKLQKNGVLCSQFISFTFWWKCYKNRTKNSKVTDVNIHITMQI